MAGRGEKIGVPKGLASIGWFHPATYDAEPVSMKRNAQRSGGGKGFSLTSNAKYGTDGTGGQGPTEMGRSTKASRGGSGNSRPPGNATRYTTGVDLKPGKGYAVGGV